MFPLQRTPLHNPYTAPCAFSTHESNAAVHFLKNSSRVALLLPSLLLWTQTGFLSLQISPWETEKIARYQIWLVQWMMFHHWNLVFCKKHLHREGIVCWIMFPSHPLHRNTPLQLFHLSVGGLKIPSTYPSTTFTSQKPTL